MSALRSFEGSYENLISNWRFRPTTRRGRTIAVEAASDRSRVVFCEAFRQLHRKAQVFSLDDDGSARTRLTHSLEVAQIGKYLVQQILEIAERDKSLSYLGLNGKHEAILSFVETACLTHDIGNPPFGHFGELAIRHWFERHEDRFASSWCGSSKKKKDNFSKWMKDFIYFDGNPQGFRILTKLIWGTDEHSLNLTGTQLASTLKYCCPPSEIQETNPIMKKAGYFESEVNVAHTIFNKLGMKINTRHPLVYLMEAADDIAYCLSDIEDSIEKGLLNEEDLLRRLEDQISYNGLLKEYKRFIPKKGEDGKFIQGGFLIFRTGCISSIVKCAAHNFVENHHEYYCGTAGPILESIKSADALLNFMKGIAKSQIYNSKIVLKNEIIGSKVITGLLDAFLPLMDASSDRFKSVMEGKQKDGDGCHISAEKALFHRLPRGCLQTYKFEVSKKGGDGAEHFHRAHMIIDFISGLTDSQALELYRLAY
jgi:dGTPase